MADDPKPQAGDGNFDELPPAKPRNLEARKAAFAEFNKLEGRTVEEPTEPPVKEAAKSDVASPKSDTEPKAEQKGEEKADAQPPKAEEKEKSDASKEEIKMVPLAALHETREKLKARNLEVRNYEVKTAALEQEVAEIKAALNAPKPAEKKDATPNPEVSELRRQLQLVQAQLQSEQVKKAQASQEEQVKEFQAKIAATNTALDEAGFPGFDTSVAAVDAEIKRMFEAGELTKEECATPETWKAVYTEKVFPSLETRMEERKRRLTNEQKIAAKKKANLVAVPGAKPAEEEDEKPDFTPETYFKKRRTLS